MNENVAGAAGTQIMPFTLAHPAAVLPLRRFCPDYLYLPALIIGSMAPDFAACVDDLEYFSHTFAGSIVFCLPFGLAALWIFHRTRSSLSRSLPAPHCEWLTARSSSPAPSFPSVITSLMLGSWIHIAWDLFTHDHSELVRRIAFLHLSVHGVPLNRLIWLLSSLAGCVVLVIAYRTRFGPAAFRLELASPADRQACARWACLLAIPLVGSFVMVHYSSESALAGGLLRTGAMYYLGCAFVMMALVALSPALLTLMRPAR